MKKTIMAFMLICVLSLAFAVPAMASDAKVAPEPTTTAEYQGITPFIEMTRAYWRNHQGQLQMRIWGMTSGRWLTDWITI